MNIQDHNKTESHCRCLLVRYILHQISLIVFVCIYLIFGGIFFAFIESEYYLKKDDERKEIIHESYENIRLFAVQLLNEQLNENFENAYHQWRWENTKLSNYIYLNKERATLLDNRTQFELENLALRLAMQQAYADKFVYKWSYSTAILYAATLVTTIGYGNISPKTALGKISTVICRIIFFNYFKILFSVFCIRCINRYSFSCFMVKISRRFISINRNKILSTFRKIY
jgi:hypothetical protein